MNDWQPVYPPEGIQHRRAVQALAAIEAMMDHIDGGSKRLLEQRDKIKHWLEECRKDTQKREVSRGAVRDLVAWMKGFESAKDMWDGDEVRAWSYCLYAAYTFLVDAKATCPSYFHGRHWAYLLQTVETLVASIEKRFPDAPTKGTEIYENAFV